MKYEAKFINYVGKTNTSYNTFNWTSATGDKNITSTALEGPISGINISDSQGACANLGSNFHLITNAEWTKIARNTELVAENWNTSIVGNGFMFLGHNDNNPGNALFADTNDSNGYYGTGDSISSPGDGNFYNFPSNDERAYIGQKRTLFLSNSEVIWDLSGNVWEWNNDTCSQGDPWESSLAFFEWTDSNVNGIEKLLAGPIGSYTGANGVGRYYGCIISENGFLKGGAWYHGGYAGAFSLYLDHNTSYTSGWVGFRCVYTP